MENFIFNGEDYVDHIKTPEDMKLFERLKELESELVKPFKECYKAVKEAHEIRGKLMNIQVAKIIIMDKDPQLN